MDQERRALLACVLLAAGLVAVGYGLTRPGLFEGEEGATPPTFPLAPPRPASSDYLASLAPPPAAGAPKLLQAPTLSKTAIAFSFAGEIWVVARAGARRGGSSPGSSENDRPIFSPDGSQIAFTGTYDGNADVYVVPASGGEPRRLTYHPGPDEPVGWTPDGTQDPLSLLCARRRATCPKLFTVASPGRAAPRSSRSLGQRRQLLARRQAPRVRARTSSGSRAGSSTAAGRRRPSGSPTCADSHITKIPRTDSNDCDPMWVGDTVYFLSDRNGPATLFAYDTKSNDRARGGAQDPDGLRHPLGVRRARRHRLRAARRAPPRTTSRPGKTRLVPVTISADLPQVAPALRARAAPQVLHAAISPTGKRVLFEARGEILSVPAEKGDVRNLTRSPGVADRDPAWSPDGKWIAWLSDESGEYALYFRSARRPRRPRKIDLGDAAFLLLSPRWSPDSKKILLPDKRLNLWLVDVEHADAAVKIDTDRFDDPDAFARPDLVARLAVGRLREAATRTTSTAIFVYSVEDKKIHQVTDGRSDASSAALRQERQVPLVPRAAPTSGLGQGGSR